MDTCSAHGCEGRDCSNIKAVFRHQNETSIVVWGLLFLPLESNFLCSHARLSLAGLDFKGMSSQPSVCLSTHASRSPT